MEQLHSVCQSHKDKIKGLFQTKLDEVGVTSDAHVLLELASMFTTVDGANQPVLEIILKRSQISEVLCLFC